MSAVKRIEKYLEERAKIRSMNGDIHGFHIGDDAREAILVAQDIELIIEQNRDFKAALTAISHGHPCPSAIARNALENEL